MAQRKMGRKIRVGVIGVGRGQTFMHQAPLAGMELVAICDQWKENLVKVGKQYKIATYTDYDKFLEHDMDAVFSLADVISVLVGGRILARGAPDAIRVDTAVRAAYLGDAEAA